MSRTTTMLLAAALWLGAAAGANAQQHTQPSSQPEYGAGAGSQPPAAQPQPQAQQQQPMGGEQAAGGQKLLINTDSLIGAQVRDPEGKEMGSLKQLMVDPSTGKVQLAVIAVGGVLGMGEKQVAVPWDSLKLARDQEEVIVTANRQLIEQAPAEDGTASAEPERDEDLEDTEANR